MENKIVSKVTRHSKNEDVLRDTCERAKMAGTPYQIREFWAEGNWWTEFTIYYPEQSK